MYTYLEKNDWVKLDKLNVCRLIIFLIGACDIYIFQILNIILSLNLLYLIFITDMYVN